MIAKRSGEGHATTLVNAGAPTFGFRHIALDLRERAIVGLLDGEAQAHSWTKMPAYVDIEVDLYLRPCELVLLLERAAPKIVAQKQNELRLAWARICLLVLGMGPHQRRLQSFRIIFVAWCLCMLCGRLDLLRSTYGHLLAQSICKLTETPLRIEKGIQREAVHLIESKLNWVQA